MRSARCKAAGCWPLLLAVLLVGCDPGPADAPTPGKRSKGGAARVDVVELVPQTLRVTLERPATLEPRLELRIFNQEEGRLTMLGPYEGDEVAKGELLARFDDRLLQAELSKAEVTLKQARLDLNRLERLVKRELVSAEAIERARTALAVADAEARLLRIRLDYGVIRAPFAGVVSARLVEPGDVLAKFSHLLTLTQLRPLVAEVGVSELWLPRLAVGDTVRIRIDALPGRQFDGRIERIHPSVDRNTRQGMVEVVLDPVPDGARPGQFSRVRFESRPFEALLVPFAALQYDSEGEYVMRVDADGKVRRAAVRTGDGHGDRLQVLEGLQPGARVVVRGLLGLKDGAQVQVNSVVGAAVDAATAQPGPR